LSNCWLDSFIYLFIAFTYSAHSLTVNYFLVYLFIPFRALIFVSHGFGEHSQRYANYLVPALVREGFLVISHDHGKTIIVQLFTVFVLMGGRSGGWHSPLHINGVPAHPLHTQMGCQPTPYTHTNGVPAYPPTQLVHQKFIALIFLLLRKSSPRGLYLLLPVVLKNLWSPLLHKVLYIYTLFIHIFFWISYLLHF